MVFFPHFFSAMCYGWGFFTAGFPRSTCRWVSILTTWNCYKNHSSWFHWWFLCHGKKSFHMFPLPTCTLFFRLPIYANIRLPIGQKKCGKSYYCGYCGRLNGFVAEWSFFPRGLLPHRPSMCDVQISDFVGRCPVGFWNRGWSLIDIPTLWGWFR